MIDAPNVWWLNFCIEDRALKNLRGNRLFILGRILYYHILRIEMQADLLICSNVEP